ncbi:MAG: hypothetical protein ACHQZR_02140 [Candidatus Limnocylindrales bacterium]
MDLSTAPPVDAWLVDLAVEVLARGEREGVRSWDLRLDGRRRRGIRATLIVQPGVAGLVWVHYAPPLGDSFRKSYRQLLRWNDELPFAKFALGADERLILTTEIAPTRLDRDAVGLALARVIAICDLLWEESAHWVLPGGASAAGQKGGAPSAVLERYRDALGDLEMSDGPARPAGTLAADPASAQPAPIGPAEQPDPGEGRPT